MKKLIIVLFLIQIVIISAWGIYSQKWFMNEASRVDPKSGMVIKQDTPENTLTSYYELLRLQEYGEAVKLITPNSRKNITAKSMEEMDKRTKMGGAALERVFPAQINGNLAVVAFVRSATIEKKVFMVGLSIFKINNNRWEKVEQADELGLPQIKTLIGLAVKAEENMLNEQKNQYGISNFSDPDQVRMITDQINSMLASHKQALQQLKQMQSQQGKQNSQVPNKTDKTKAPQKSAK